MDVIAMFFTGALLCNAIPHLASGLRGEAFPTPFATPRGIGRSSALINFVWGVVNLLIAGWLAGRHGVPTVTASAWLAAATGFVAMGLFASIHFAKARKTWE
ncbi:conserved membrane protein of unknown function [Pararobbsia alpina]|uniref:hypothetical protein n=1 Tax=Pararobbsia alpina TaxID=621374 RepID=UPI0039A4027F